MAEERLVTLSARHASTLKGVGEAYLALLTGKDGAGNGTPRTIRLRQLDRPHVALRAAIAAVRAELARLEGVRDGERGDGPVP